MTVYAEILQTVRKPFIIKTTKPRLGLKASRCMNGGLPVIELLAKLVSPLILPMGVSYADLLFYLNAMSGYLLAGGIALILLLLILIFAHKLKKGWRAWARCQAVIAFLAVVVLIVNMVCYGPMQNTLSAYLNASKVELAEDTVAQSLATIRKIGEQGFVLLKNEDSTLPITSAEKRLNVFGWASTKPYIGGTGSSASSAATATDILQALKDAGYETNETLTKLYTDYASERPAADMFGQNLTLPEPTMDAYTDDIMAEAKDFSDTALVVISRGGGENYDLPTDMNAVIHGTYNISSEVSIAPDIYPYTKVTYQNNGDYDDFEPGESYLELSVTEEKLLDLVCANFDKVVVLINACNPMELGFLDEHDNIDAALLAPAPGVQGFAALGSILSGEVNPSGRTADTYVKDLTQTPNYNNTGVFTYENTEDLQQAILKEDSTYQGSMAFVNYSEGIYVGYKFYETAADEGLIDYEATVQYPFGYGLSYTTFEKKIDSFSDMGDTITLTVDVRNTGSVAGRDVVEIYYNPPYTNGGIEKASVNLIDFAKTSVINPGSSEKIYFSISKESLASYDENGVKVANGGYILEAGTYEISVRSDSHTVDDSRTFTVSDDVTYETASNKLQDTTRGDFVQLSRKDHFANYEEATAAPAQEQYQMSDETKATVEKNTVAGYKSSDYDNADGEKPTMGDKESTLTLADMAGADYDDERWEELLNKMTYKEMNNLINAGGWQTAEVKSIGKSATSDCDGPAGLNNYITGSYGTTYPAEVLMAQTWSKEVAFEIGASMGSEFAAAKNYGWYGPAMNLHRSAFAGRNFEYYSEDGVLSGCMALNEVNGAAQFGVYAYIKHFALNDQELNRTAILLTYAGEQNIRENYLKPFEMVVKNFTGKSLAVMSSYNWLGSVPAYANNNLLNGILRDEWGFQGMVQSDYDGSYGYMITDAAIRNGGDMMLGYGSYDSNKLTQKSATLLYAMRRACKNILYTVVNSGYYESADETEPTETVNKMDQLFGQINLTAGCALGVLELLLLVWLVVKMTKKKAKKA